MISLPNPRYERKFVAESLSLAEVLAIVRRHPALFRECYPARWVNNLYLDTQGLQDYYDHVAGIAHRSKTRIRWYGGWSDGAGAPTLERKIKIGQVGGKESHRLPSLSLNGGSSPSALTAALRQAELPGRTAAALPHLCPSLLNRYRRAYFQSADGAFRLTVDADLSFAAARPWNGGTHLRWMPASGIVVELKYTLPSASRAMAVTNAMPFRLVRHSKYVQGIGSLAPGHG